LLPEETLNESEKVTVNGAKGKAVLILKNLKKLAKKLTVFSLIFSVVSGKIYRHEYRYSSAG